MINLNACPNGSETCAGYVAGTLKANEFHRLVGGVGYCGACMRQQLIDLQAGSPASRYNVVAEEQ